MLVTLHTLALLILAIHLLKLGLFLIPALLICGLLLIKLVENIIHKHQRVLKSLKNAKMLGFSLVVALLKATSLMIPVQSVMAMIPSPSMTYNLVWLLVEMFSKMVTLTLSLV